MAKHKAWIPNVSGSLSFSNIKGAMIPGRAETPKTFNYLSNNSLGLIASLQRRNLSDAIFARLDPGGVLLYLLTAKVETEPENGEVLSGHIYTFPEQQLDHADRKSLQCFLRQALDQNELKILINKWRKKSETIEISFKLHRDGFAELDYQGEDDNESSFIFETFSFLKDLVHSHKFHRYDDDAIVVPYPIVDDADIKWAERTLRNLHKSIVSTYRNAHYRADLINALGRLSYLESFQTIVQQKYSAHIKEFQPINVSVLRKSLETRLDALGEIEDRKSVFFQISVPILLSLFALLIAMTQLLQVPCIDGLTTSDMCNHGGKPFAFKLGNGSIEIARHLLEHWNEYAISMPITAVMVFVITYFSSVQRWLSNELGRGILGWIQRVTFGLALSGRFGRVMATVWVLILVGILLGLLLVGMGLLRVMGF